MFSLFFTLLVFTVGFSSTAVAEDTKSINTVKHEEDGCICKECSCGCCVTLDVPEIGLNDTGCVNIAVLPKEYGISVTLTIDGSAIINETISVRNPPPICVEPPFMDDFIHICLHFYDLDIEDTKFHGCVQLEMKLFYVFALKEWKLGCFDLDMLLSKHNKHMQKLFKNVSKNMTESNSVMSVPDWKAFKKVLQSKASINYSKLDALLSDSDRKAFKEVLKSKADSNYL